MLKITDSELNKEELFEILVRLGYLKAANPNAVSVFVARENITQFNRICQIINPQNTEHFEVVKLN